MGYELLEQILGILTDAGIRAGEEYPAGERVEILSPVAAVGLRELDWAGGTVRFSLRILSPRILGGWCCQTHAAKVGQVLHGAGMTSQTEPMEYLSGSDCFCVSMTATMAVGDGGAEPVSVWRVFCGETEQEQVVSFRAVRNQGRRIVGSLWESEPDTVTPGSGGWEIELVQSCAGEPEEGEEPFVLTVLCGGSEHRYGGCRWNETEILHSRTGVKRIRRGFALSREVYSDG